MTNSVLQAIERLKGISYPYYNDDGILKEWVVALADAEEIIEKLEIDILNEAEKQKQEEKRRRLEI